MPAITLTHPTAASGLPLELQLPPDLVWSDQYTWSKVEEATQYASTGTLVIDFWVRQSGRPITLSGEQNRAWCERGPLTTLRAWADTPDLVLQLSLHGSIYSVGFVHGDGGAIDAAPLPELLAGGPADYEVRAPDGSLITTVEVDYTNPRATDPFAVTLRLRQL